MMLTMRDICREDRDIVLPMVEQFYHSDAVDHVVPMETLERSFHAAVDPNQPLLRGVLLSEGKTPMGFLYLTICYSCEVGGECLFIEELFIKEEFRGKGYGKAVMDWLVKEYPQCRRLRLEVTQVNQTAIRLYEKCGFTWLRYDQMVLDR